MNMRLPRNQLIQGPCLAYATLTPSESLSFRFRLAGLRSTTSTERLTTAGLRLMPPAVITSAAPCQHWCGWLWKEMEQAVSSDA